MSATSGLIKVLKKGAKAPEKAAPFYSAVDEVALGLTRNKGTGKEFLREIEKSKGVKPAEIKDRNLDKVLNTDQKMTKDELVKVLEDNPPKQITEDILGEPTQKMIDQKIEDLIEQEVREELGPRPRYGYEREDWLEDYDRLIEQKSENANDYYEAAKQAIKEEGDFGVEKYSEYKLPGGENYREILLKLPATKSANTERIMELEAKQRRGGTNQAMDEELARLKAEASSAPEEYKSSHWEQPNVLAHMRVQDRVGPNGEKVLHVEEIQSDWHQQGREKGYKLPSEETAPMDSEYRALIHKNADARAAGIEPDPKDVERAKQLEAELIRSDNSNIPNAPFKKNWHELAMKRLINYAAENGYDKIAITPGAEQAKRYDLSKRINDLQYDPQTKTLTAWDHSGNKVIEKTGVSEDELPEYIGKEGASKLLAKNPQDTTVKQLFGADLEIGGEGMKGFYDQMLPAYLNKYGEKYGAKAELGGYKLTSPDGRSHTAMRLGVTPQEYAAMSPEDKAIFHAKLDEINAIPLHSFDITPQMREEVLTKGQPLYQQIGIPAATGAAGAEMLGAGVTEEPEFAEGGAVNENTVPDMSDGANILQGQPFKRGGKVSITNNPDTMFLELSDKKFRRK